ncbi:aKG-HExxH-type peptide beta-hydroxylase [Actinoplanes palleronii]|uniref:HEXXH motif-containing protein n=1 Tax=Actinoplanes palleronii TaxID=113570 RepID=A0ABQ4B6D6_9ACTN|nr:HEXXH motif-containing putative peptide modification protein [Actinoplanes palleronii]GIE66244.1 hypothetical protein Apa02nite_023520 [Actinoplanes palleronii]
MRPFRIADADLADLGAGRPSSGTLGLLRRAQLSRHLLLLLQLRRAVPDNPVWYVRSGTMTAAAFGTRAADPMTGLWAARVLATVCSERAPGWANALGDLPAPAGHPLTVTHAGRALAVRLDDSTPFRHLLGLAPTGPLAPGEVAHWRASLDAAWRILVTGHPAAAGLLTEVLRVIVPARPDPLAEGVSATSAEAFGAIAMSAPVTGAGLAVALLHETQHSVLNAVHGLFELVEPGAGLRYSPWREDPRPAYGVLHGVYAFLAVTRFWRAELARGAGGTEAAFEFARWRVAVYETAGELLGGGVLTPAGARLVTALRDEVEPWLTEPVDTEVVRLAGLARADHRARWRLRNLTVAPDDVTALAGAWRAGHPAPAVDSTVTATAPAARPSARLRLIRAVLRGDRPADAPDGELACLDGRWTSALRSYETGLDLDEETVWSGLALVSPHLALRRRPELVRAAALAVPEADIADLAAWLSA